MWRSTKAEKCARILEAIPCDRWVTAIEISAVVGLSPHVVGAQIRSRLLGVHVKRRQLSSGEGKTALYRRLI